MYSLKLARNNRSLQIGLFLLFAVAAFAMMACDDTEINGREGIVGLDEAVGKATDPILQPLRDGRDAAVDAVNEFDACNSKLINSKHVNGCK